jgi:hypothetical protein
MRGVVEKAGRQDVGSSISGTVNFSLRIMKKYRFLRREPFNDGDF